MILNILAVSAEAYPLAKTGGLGDAVSGLCRALCSSGAVRVTLMLPAYPGALAQTEHLSVCARLHGLACGTVTLLKGFVPVLGLPVLLVHHEALYGREGIYADAEGTEYPDNAIRFAVLAQAAACVAQGLPGDQQASMVEGLVCAHDAQDHLWSLQLGQHQLHWTEADAHYAQGAQVRLRILARDVSLALAPPQGSSILNSLPATITAIQQATTPGQVLVQLRLPHGADAILLALISARSARLLDIRENMPVHAQLKSVAVLR